MESFVLVSSGVSSLALPLFKPRARALYALFLHMLLLLTAGSLAMRTLSGGGLLLVPFVDGWTHSPLMTLNGLRAYSVLAVSLLSTTVVCSIRGRIILSLPPASPPQAAFLNSPYCCAVGFWVHLTAILLIIAL